MFEEFSAMYIILFARRTEGQPYRVNELAMSWSSHPDLWQRHRIMAKAWRPACKRRDERHVIG